MTAPSAIVVLTDQPRWDITGVHGNPADVTPEFDRIAREGTHVEQAITPNPVCAPARSSLQTGRFPTATGVFRNGLALPSDIPTLAGAFARAGYVTGYLGKWHLAGADQPDGPVPPERRDGYREWLASESRPTTSPKPQPAAATRAMTEGLDALPSASSPLLDITGEQHAAWTVRLFAS